MKSVNLSFFFLFQINSITLPLTKINKNLVNTYTKRHFQVKYICLGKTPCVLIERQINRI